MFLEYVKESELAIGHNKFKTDGLSAYLHFVNWLTAEGVLLPNVRVGGHYHVFEYPCRAPKEYLYSRNLWGMPQPNATPIIEPGPFIFN